MNCHPAAMFIYNNVPLHPSHVTKQFLDIANIATLFWPAISPDLNLIELILAIMRKIPKTCSSNNLFYVLIDIWDGLDDHFIRLLTSMLKRISSVIATKVSYTKFWKLLRWIINVCMLGVKVFFHISLFLQDFFFDLTILIHCFENTTADNCNTAFLTS